MVLKFLRCYNNYEFLLNTQLKFPVLKCHRIIKSSSIKHVAYILQDLYSRRFMVEVINFNIMSLSRKSFVFHRKKQQVSFMINSCAFQFKKLLDLDTPFHEIGSIKRWKVQLDFVKNCKRRLLIILIYWRWNLICFPIVVPIIEETNRLDVTLATISS